MDGTLPWSSEDVGVGAGGAAGAAAVAGVAAVVSTWGGGDPASTVAEASESRLYKSPPTSTVSSTEANCFTRTPDRSAFRSTVTWGSE